MPYNIISCKGFGEVLASGKVAGLAGGDCIKARLALVFLFFAIAIIRKWGAEEWGIPYSFWYSMGAGLLSYLIVVSIFGSVKWAFGIGFVLALVMGYGSGAIFGGSDEGGGNY